MKMGALSVVYRSEIISALRVAGCDAVISVKHEAALLSRDEGLARAVEFPAGARPPRSSQRAMVDMIDMTKRPERG